MRIMFQARLVFVLLSVFLSTALPVASAGELYAVEFDGEEDFFRVRHDESLNPGRQNWTCEFWVKVLSDFERNHNKFLSKRDGIEDAGGFYVGSMFAPACSYGNRQNLNYRRHIPLGEWTHVAVQIDRDAGKLRAFVNGNRVEEADSRLTGAVSASSDLIIGADSVHPPQGNHARLRELRIWKGVNVTREQIRARMNSSLSGSEEGLAGYWPMDEGAGRIIHDRSGGNNHAELANRCPGNVFRWVEVEAPPPVEEEGEVFIIDMSGVLTGSAGQERRGSVVWWLPADPHLHQDENKGAQLINAIRDVREMGNVSKTVVLGDLGEPLFSRVMNEHMRGEDWTYILGNHDVSSAPGRTALPVNYFSETIHGVRIIAISDEYTRGGENALRMREEQENWLKNELRGDPGIPTVMLVHQPPYRSTAHHPEGVVAFRKGNWLYEEIDDYNIVLWIAGHCHRWRIDENAGGYGFDQILVDSITTIHGGAGDVSAFLVIDEGGGINVRFRNHKLGEWISVFGYREYVIETGAD